MNAVNISVGGLLSSIFFIFLCISLNAEEFYKELNAHDKVKAVSLKPKPKLTVILRDRNLSNNISKIKVTNPLLYKPILKKELNCTMLKDKKKERLRVVKEPLSAISDDNLSSPHNIVENIQNKISMLLYDKQITFKKSSGTLSREGKNILDKLLILFSDQKSFMIEVQGHTDAIGKVKVNQWISQLRANRVKEYLVQKGIPSKNIQAKGFGETKLLLIDKPYSQKNRRVEIYIKRRKNVRIND